MPPSVKDARVTKPSASSSSQLRSSSRSRSSGSLKLSKWRKERVAREDAPSSSKTNNLPLVERTNALPLDQFIERYIPSERLRLTVSRDSNSKKKKEATDPSDKSAAAASQTGDKPEQQQGESPVDTNTTTDNEESYTIDIHTAESIPEADFEACFALIELTSSKDYANSSIGWSPAKKRKEMRLPDMRYMLLRRSTPTATAEATETATSNIKEDSSPNNNDEKTTSEQDLTQKHQQEPKQLSGFLSFMTTYEDAREVLYCYEIHLDPSTQGQGLGAQLMSLFEEIGQRIGLEKAMLTVFRANVAARKFYDRLGYEVDEFSPQPKRLRDGKVKEVDYLILSKKLR
ncbi:hypothetical protein VTN77DRAFT_5025 [Rasamsonia byssochlamydoides]|uniref:uncharacterized protein n=1 Tax=Rasamsonia byssochlamydoides TaxID=89139 RepID=UPI003742EE52